MHTILETPEFMRCTKALGMSDAERQELISYLSQHLMAGDEIAGTGGARKLRFARPGMGKSGSYRIITFYSGEFMPTFLFSAFAKNQKINLTQSEKNTLKKVLKLLADHYENVEVLQ